MKKDCNHKWREESGVHRITDPIIFLRCYFCGVQGVQPSPSAEIRDEWKRLVEKELRRMRSATKKYWEVHAAFGDPVTETAVWFYALGKDPKDDIVHLGYSAEEAWRFLEKRKMLNPSDYTYRTVDP